MRRLKRKLIPLCCTLLLLCVMVCSSFSVNAMTYDPGQTFETTAIALVNLNTDTTIYEKNADQKMYPASTTKIMTYIVTVEAVPDLNTVVTVTEEAVSSLDGTGSSLAGVEIGENLTILQLLNLMMIPSGNDAAAVLAYYVGNGSEEAFVEMMNQKAQELGCTNTHFANAHGLQDPDHYTTANDMAKIAKYALNLPEFVNITGKTSYTLPATNIEPEERTVITTNKMLLSSEPEYYYQYATGIKTGTTDEAGYCLVSAATYENSQYLCVALGAPSVDAQGNAIETRKDMIDSANLYRWAFTKLQLKTIAQSKTAAAELPLKYVWGRDTISLYPETDLSGILPDGVNASSVMVQVDLPEEVKAPVHPGDIIGTATYSYAGQTLGTVNLVVREDLSRNQILAVLDVIIAIISSPIFLICFILFLILLAVYIVLVVRYNKKRQKIHQKRNRYRNKRR